MIRLLVDSSSDYSLEELKQKNIELIPIHITIGQADYADGIDLQRDEFYQILHDSAEFPKTSQPSPQAFLEIFQEVCDSGDELIFLSLSSALSGTFQSAAIAKSMVGCDRIYLVDSLSATYTIKVMADHADALRRAGVPAKEIVAQLEALKGRVKVVAALDTLEYLYRGGRLSRTSAVMGSIAQVKPLLTLNNEGRIVVLGKCLGRGKALREIVRLLHERTLDPGFPVYSVYTSGTENAELLEETLQQSGVTAADRLQIGATIGTHIGPGAYGVVFVEQ